MVRKPQYYVQRIGRRLERMRFDWPGRSKLVAFTFDDGPSKYTETLLDGLGSRNVPATFFMNGKNGTGGVCGIENGHRKLVSRMWAEGHQLANHTYRHADLRKLSSGQIIEEITDAEKLIFEEAGGSYICFLRTPYGADNENIMQNIKVPVALWHLDAEDWKYRDPDCVYNNIVSEVKGEDIVLLHDIYETSVTGALRAIDTLKEQGYEFVTVAELMRRTRVYPVGGQVYRRGKNVIWYLPPYRAPKVKILNGGGKGYIRVLPSGLKGIPVYYTTDGSYPRLSDSVYTGDVAVKPGMTFTAVGVDKWGTRTPPTSVVI